VSDSASPGSSPSLRRLRQRLQQLDHPLAVALARRPRPVVLKPLEQLAAAQLQSRERLARRQPLELARVDPQTVLVVQHRVIASTSSDVPIRRRSDHSALRKLARALRSRTSGQNVVDQLGARHGTRRERQIREQGPRPLRCNAVNERSRRAPLRAFPAGVRAAR
jgi:hypothetical protein